MWLVQRRAASKYHCGGRWANTCCTHPHWGESPTNAARRRLEEELGLTGLELSERRTVDYRAEVGQGLIEHERVTLYTQTVDPDALRFVLNPEEVDEVAWWDVGELAARLAQHPDTLAPWFQIYLERFPDLVI